MIQLIHIVYPAFENILHFIPIVYPANPASLSEISSASFQVSILPTRLLFPKYHPVNSNCLSNLVLTLVLTFIFEITSPSFQLSILLTLLLFLK